MYEEPDIEQRILQSLRFKYESLGEDFIGSVTEAREGS
jgi:hypothetical protein